MRIALYVAGVLCILVGGVWFLQGVNVFPGSFMTGQTKWAIYGAVIVVIGVAFVIAASRRVGVRAQPANDR